MTTLSALIGDLQRSTARDDAEATYLMIRGVNAGIIAAALIFRPSELREVGSLTVGTDGYVSISLDRFLTIEEIYNSTGTARMWPLEFGDLMVLELPTTGNALFYSIYGDVLHVRPVPASDETLSVYYLALPARLTAEGDTIPLDNYQDFIFSFAQAFVWASFEEPESQQTWEKIAAATGQGWQVITQIRDVLNKQVPDVHNVQTAIPKSTSTSPSIGRQGVTGS